MVPSSALGKLEANILYFSLAPGFNTEGGNELITSNLFARFPPLKLSLNLWMEFSIAIY
jgi:hypothetical protein